MCFGGQCGRGSAGPAPHVCPERPADAPRCPATLVAGGCQEPGPFVLAQKGLVTGLNGSLTPTEQDSFRRLVSVPQACLVSVLATSAGQVVRRVPGAWAGQCSGPPADLFPAGPRKGPVAVENGNFTPSPGGRPACGPAGPVGTRPLHPTLLCPGSFSHAQGQARTDCKCWLSFREFHTGRARCPAMAEAV